MAKKSVKAIIYQILMLFFLWACNSNTATKSKEKSTENNSSQNKITKENFKPATIISKVICNEDTRFSYALYLPKNYNEKENWPLLILFDAHAAATLPLAKYKTICDKFGFVMACSNESKNGIAQTIYADIKTAIQNDITQKIKINPKRIYLGGFSGGARVAINLTVADISIAGVIANSAGFEPSRAKLRNELVFVGMAGNEDFNLREQSKTEKSLNEYPFPHCFIEFDGKHDWAPETSMEEAFLFLDCIAKRNSQNIKNNTILKTSFAQDSSKFSKLTKETDKFIQLTKINAFYVGIFELKNYKTQLAKLIESSKIKKWMSQKDADELKEGTLQNDYYQKVFSENLEWWHLAVKNLNAEKNNKDKYKLNKRLLSYISLGVYMTINSKMAQQDDFEMEKFISVYSLVDPTNAEWAYCRAVLRAKQGNSNEAINFLKKAIALGFNDKQRAKNQVEFSNLFSDNASLKMFE